ncbi:AAA family ATPase [Aquisalimonas lutea]|uniref:AAA family ATPase n=1 Tax=Aquisalimonas lutea TaxID=1327750 RepID=UPI0025B32250|nr:AAA family ATPase [Aquisalimonas lutea]MDN3518309.1 AAA family ATPase [Aquisalimonas lutea]
MSERSETAAPSGTLQGRFHYSDGERETRTNLLLQHLQLGEQVVILEGDPGSGRTHLLRHVLARRDHGLQIYAVHAEPGLTLTELLVGMLEHLQLPPAPSEAPDRVRRHAVERIAAMTRNGEMPVLALDDADSTDDDLLAGLLAFREETRAEGAHALGLLLAGSPRLALRVDEHAGTGEGTAVTVPLHGLERAGTRAFLEQALKADGDGQGHLLGTLDVEAIHAASGGRPGLILQAARKQLAGEQAAASARRRPPTALDRLGSRRSITLVSAAMAALVAALLILAWLGGDEPQEPETVTIEDREIAAADDASGDGTSGDGAADDSSMADGDADEARPAPADDGSAGDDAVDRIGNSDDFAFTDPGTEESAAGTPADGEQDAEEAPSTAAQDPDDTATGGGESGEAAQDSGPEDRNGGEPAGSTPEAGTTTQSAEAPAEESDGESAAETTDEPRRDDREATSPLARALAEGRRWREAQPGEAWTIQLVGAYSGETVLDWLQARETDRDLHLLRTQRDGRDWYIVVTGAEAERQQARASRDNLPEALRENDPWIRRIQGLDGG